MNTIPETEVWITEASDRSLLVSFGREAHSGAMSLFRQMSGSPILGVTNLHPAYDSLLIRFDPIRISAREIEHAVRHLVRFEPAVEPDPRTVTIPVCYAREYGPDLGDVAELHRLSEAAVVELHAGKIYTVYFLGFVPGFAYLGMLPEQLSTPRLPTPRKQVPRGSVGIADRQTGVYPAATPGGWRLIGRTPLAMFEPSRRAMSLLQPGDRVRFQPISPDEFEAEAG